MTYPDDDDELEFADYDAMDINFYNLRHTKIIGIEDHPLFPRAQAEGWTTDSPDLELYKAQGDIQYGINPRFLYGEGLPDNSWWPQPPPGPRWKGLINGEGYFWKDFDTLGDALDAFRDRNFRGFERVLPDPDNDIDSDYEMVVYQFAVARGEQPE